MTVSWSLGHRKILAKVSSKSTASLQICFIASNIFRDLLYSKIAGLAQNVKNLRTFHNLQGGWYRREINRVSEIFCYINVVSINFNTTSGLDSMIS